MLGTVLCVRFALATRVICLFGTCPAHTVLASGQRAERGRGAGEKMQLQKELKSRVRDFQAGNDPFSFLLSFSEEIFDKKFQVCFTGSPTYRV